MSIILASYNRSVQDVRDVERLFTYGTTGKDETFSDGDRQAMKEGFKKCFTEYLHGVGHVQGLVDADEYRKRRRDRLFRACAALRQFTDSWLLPIDSHEGSILVPTS